MKYSPASAAAEIEPSPRHEDRRAACARPGCSRTISAFRTRHHALYCSDKCTNNHVGKRARDRIKLARPPKTCAATTCSNTIGPDRQRNATYCSRKCQATTRNTRLRKPDSAYTAGKCANNTCLNMLSAADKRGRKKYCSTRCAEVARRLHLRPDEKYPPVQCEIPECRNIIPLERRRRVAGPQATKYCSETCSNEALKRARRRDYTPSTTTNLLKGHLGAAGEITVCADLLRKGYSVFRSVAFDSPYDLVISSGRKMYRVEVKTSRRRKRSRTIQSGLAGRQKGIADFLAIALEDGEIVYKPSLPDARDGKANGAGDPLPENTA